MLAFVGFMLSPLSWWNDLFVNVPLAFGAAWAIDAVLRTGADAFSWYFIAAYWLTNLAGFLIMHRGVRLMKGEGRENHRRELVSSLFWTIAYSGAVLALTRTEKVRSLIGSFLER